MDDEFIQSLSGDPSDMEFGRLESMESVTASLMRSTSRLGMIPNNGGMGRIAPHSLRRFTLSASSIHNRHQNIPPHPFPSISQSHQFPSMDPSFHTSNDSVTSGASGTQAQPSMIQLYYQVQGIEERIRSLEAIVYTTIPAAENPQEIVESRRRSHIRESLRRGDLDRICLPVLEENPYPNATGQNEIVRHLERFYPNSDRRELLSQVPSCWLLNNALLKIG